MTGRLQTPGSRLQAREEAKKDVHVPAPSRPAQAGSPTSRATSGFPEPVERVAGAAALCLVWLLLALPAAARGADDPKAFTVVSPNAEFEAAQVSQGSSCRVEIRRGTTIAWSARRCFGDRNDGHFLSNDGSTLMVVHAFPSKRAGVQAAPGVTLYVRGAPARSLEVGRFVRDAKPLVMARAHFYWLEGAVGQRGVPPGYSQDGKAVELTTLDRRSWSVGFDGRLKKIEMPKLLGR